MPILPSVGTILFVNDTSAEANPGCRLASAGVLDMIQAADAAPRRLPLSFWGDAFAGLDGVRKKSIKRADTGFPAFRERDEAAVDPAAWRALADDLAGNDPVWRSQSAGVDRVVLNAEGSVHHDHARALALLAVLHAANRQGIRTSVVNATIQDMSSDVVREALAPCDVIHVRETFSHRYLAELGIGSVVAPDFAVAELMRMPLDTATASAGGNKLCLYCPGVAGRLAGIEIHTETIRSLGYEIIYLGVGDRPDRARSDEIAKSGVKATVFSCQDVEIGDILERIASVDLVVSGRHHVNLMAFACGVPVVALPSNTWKIEGTIELLRYPLPVIRSREALAEAIARVADEPALWREQSRAAFAEAARLWRAHRGEIGRAVG